ncbi:MAG: TIGR02677 family protein [Oligoflexia bacterium]|nr:TIGR02677 family protein [Oligoflexia bacterium]
MAQDSSRAEASATQKTVECLYREGYKKPVSRILNQVPVFSYVTAPNAPSYRAIMQIFYEAKQQYVIEMRPTEIQKAIGERKYELATEDLDAFENPEKLSRLLEALVSWGNLQHAHDTAAVNRVEDFSRKRFIYHLTPMGEAAHRAVLEVEATLGSTGSLQSSMLRKILETLRRIGNEALNPDSAPDTYLILLHDLFSAFDTLTEEANHFIGELTSQTEALNVAGDELEERFFFRKQAILDYISRFVDQLRQNTEEIATEIASVSSTGIGQIVQRASESADVPPDFGADGSLERWRHARIAKWNGIKRWFIPEEGTDGATVERLAKVAVDSVVALTRALSRVNELRTQAIDRAADFRMLASWFSVLADDRDAHALWQMAFGLYASRHFHLVEEDSEITPPGASWWETPPVLIPVRLGTRGKASVAGRPSAVPDHGNAKALLLTNRRRERQLREAALESLARRGKFRIANLAEISLEEFEALLSLLDAVLRAPRTPENLRIARTSDAGYWVKLFLPADAGTVEGMRAAIFTPRGLLHCPDYEIELQPTSLSRDRHALEATHVAP